MNAENRKELAALLERAEDENTAQSHADDLQPMHEGEREKADNIAEYIDGSPQAEELERVADALEEAADKFTEAADAYNEALELLRAEAGA